MDLRHHRPCDAEGDVLLCFASREESRPLRLVEKIDRGDQFIGNQLAVESQSKVRSIIPRMLPRYFIDAACVRLGGEDQAEAGGISIQKSVPQVHGDALQSCLLEIVKSRDAADVIRCGNCSELHAEVLDGHKFQFACVGQRAIGAGVLCKAPGRLILKFTLTGFANIGPDHKAEQVLRINCFRMPAQWQQHAAHDDLQEYCIGTHFLSLRRAGDSTRTIWLSDDECHCQTIVRPAR